MSAIFRAYDVRGTYPDEVNEIIAAKIGKAFADYCTGRKLLVGRDMRLSSPSLARALCSGMSAGGARVSDMGMTTTPQFYYGVWQGGYDGGIMVTASHLPAHINGFKICRKDAVPLSATDGLPAIAERVARMKHMPDLPFVPGKSVSFLDEYLQYIASYVHKPRPLTLMIDAGNGMIGPEIVPFLAKFPQWKYEALYLEPDGSFPHHVANPLIASTTQDLRQRVRTGNADVGIAFDGDADRVGFIDETGEKIPEDLVTALLAMSFLSRSQAETVLYDLRSSRVVAETITAHGGKAVRSRVGHSFIKQRMREENAVFAGEMSGHYYFRDTGFTDNALFAMVQMLNLLAISTAPLSELVRPLHKYADSGEVNISVTDKNQLLKEIETHFRGAAIDYLDGVTVAYPDWWFNLRPSNTEALIRLNVEAPNNTELQKKEALVLATVKAIDPGMRRV